jgi:RecA/RadA recombinase
MEMGKDEGDKMGMRRAKEFSEECRRTCRILTKNNILMVCSNQVRQNSDAGPYGLKYRSPGGEAIPFYASLRLRCIGASKIKEEKTINEKKVQRVIGVETEIEIFKSSVWKPYRKASIYIMFDYGIDDIRANLQFVKQMTKSTSYVVRDEKAGQSMADAVTYVEKHGLENDLKEQTIDIWENIEDEFKVERKPKKR